MKKLLAGRLFWSSSFFSILLILSSVCSGGNEFCPVAMDIVERAIIVYETDKEAGLKLFIKAGRMCDSNQINYNLGVAFYRYNNPSEAQKYLEKAVDGSCTKPVWLNNLASVLVESKKNPGYALELAQKAVDLDRTLVPAHDTLARALFAAGNRLKSLQTIDASAEKFKTAGYLQKTRDGIIKQYLSHHLELIRSQDVDPGLSGLKKADHNPYVALVYCKALANLGRIDDSINAAKAYGNTFRGNQDFKELVEETISTRIMEFYLAFKNGEENKAVAAARRFSSVHQESRAAREAYDELLDALLGDVKEMELPKVRVAAAKPGNKDEGIDALLLSIGGKKQFRKGDMTLTIDVDVNIPEGKQKNSRAVALLIGNQEYQSMNKGLPDVRYAHRDVMIMAKYLEKTMGYDKENILVKKDITKGDFNTLFGTAQNQRGQLKRLIRKGKSDVFIYYTGHGSPDPKGESAFLVPVDATADYIEHNGYPLDLFYSAVRNLGARHVTIVLDTCFSGNSTSGFLFKNISPGVLKTVNPLKQLPNAALFCAADKDQVATWYPDKRHGMFSYFFLKGIQGEADTNQDKIIHLRELERYLKEEVPIHAGRESNRDQTPLVMSSRDVVIAELQ